MGSESGSLASFLYLTNVFCILLIPSFLEMTSRATRRYFSRARSYMYWWKRDPPQAGNMNIVLNEQFGLSFKKQATG